VVGWSKYERRSGNVSKDMPASNFCWRGVNEKKNEGELNKHAEKPIARTKSAGDKVGGRRELNANYGIRSGADDYAKAN